MKDWQALLRAALKRRWKRYRRAHKRCREKFSNKAVHNSRVETRRLLSLVELLEVFLGRNRLGKIRRLLKKHLNAFDPLRDTQVQLQLLETFGRQFPETKSLQEWLVCREERCLKAAARKTRRIKTSQLEKAFHNLLRRLARGKDAPHRFRHRAAVMQAVNEAFSRTVELQRAMDPGSAQTIHQTRLAFKRFRYMLEALQPLFSEITPALLITMQDYQSMMGEVQDAEVFLGRLDKYTHGDTEATRQLARFRRWLLQRETTQIAYCMRHSDRLHRFWPLQASSEIQKSRAPRRRSTLSS